MNTTFTDSPTTSCQKDEEKQDQKCGEPILLQQDEKPTSITIIKNLFKSLSLLDKLLTPMIIIAMIVGVVIGEFASNVKENLSKGNLKGVSAPLVVGLVVMMWPILTKVRYENVLKKQSFNSTIWKHIVLSFIMNWLICPFLMLALAWATLPDLPTYREGIIMVGLARCIAMVMIWTQIARGDVEMCAILVIINSLFQIVLYAPMCVWFINVISGDMSFTLQYGTTAIAVLIYLGIPLAAGIITRFAIMLIFGKSFLTNKFLPFFAPISLLALLYTIIIIFAQQSRRILHNLGPTFRTFVPLILYFSIVWTSTFIVLWKVNQHFGNKKWGGYESAVTHSFTAASNNFELAIAVAVAVYGADSDQALATTIGPLVEVPVLLILSWLALFLGEKLNWNCNNNEYEQS